MAVKFANLASSTLASSLTNSATSISATDASSFPSLGAGDYFYASIGEGSLSEIVKVTAVSSNTFTAVRGQDGTTARSHDSGTSIALRVVAAALDDISSQAQTAADTESVSIAGDTMTGALEIESTGTTQLRLERTDDAGSYLKFSDTSTSANNYVWIGASGNTTLFYSDNTNERMRITSDGTVGIAKNNPSTEAKLHVGGHIYVDTGNAIYADYFRPYSGVTAHYGSSTNTIHNFLGTINHSGNTVLTSGRALENITSIDVTGSVTADGLTVDGNGSFTGDFEISGLSPKIFLSETDTTDLNTRIRNSGGKLQVQTVNDSDASPVTRFQIDHSTGDISFYEDTGTTAKLFWDASTERLGIGNSSPTTALDVTGTVAADGLSIGGTSNFTGLVRLTGDRGTFVDSSENSAVPHIFATNDAVGDFSQEAGHLVIQSRVHTSVFRDIIFAGGTTNAKQLMRLQGEGDISFYEDTGTTAKFFWDASEEALGIGNSSPQASIHTTGDVIIGTATHGASYEGVLQIADGAVNGRTAVLIYNNHPDQFMKLGQDVNTAFIGRDNADEFAIGLFDNASDTTLDKQFVIDASGNVLVGTTEVDVGYTDSGAGCMLAPEGTLQLARSSANANLYLNKLDNDGEIINFRKDGTTVGSAGTDITGNAELYIQGGNANDHSLWVRGGDCGIRLDGALNTIIPTEETSGGVDDKVNLGNSTYRFKDLYLSGTLHAVTADVAGTVTSDGLTVAGDVSVDGGTIKLDGNFPTGNSNLALGSNAGTSIGTGAQHNVLIGNDAGDAISTGDYNTCVGSLAGTSYVGSTNSVAVGYSAGQNSVANDQVLIGSKSGQTGPAFGVVGVGYETLMNSESSGYRLVAVGYRAFRNNTSGDNNVGVGYQAGASHTTTSNNTYIGAYAGDGTGAGNGYNVAVGTYSMTGNLATGNGYNTCVGGRSGLAISSGSDNTLIGYNAGDAVSTGYDNTAVGYNALSSVNTENGNVAIGHSALSAAYSTVQSTCVGNGAGSAITTGSKNTILGAYNGNEDGLDIRALSNRIVLADGDGAVGMYIDNSQDAHFDGNVVAYSTTISDRRLKSQITPISSALNKVDQINGVTFVRDHNGEKAAGVIAQEIMEVLPEAVKSQALPLQTGNHDEKYYVVEYDAVTGLLVEAVKELKARVEALESK